MNSITLITTGQPSTNPRLMKEADTLAANGYQVTVIYCFYQSWASAFDSELMQGGKVRYICCGGSPLHDKLQYYKTRIRQRACQYLFKWIKGGSIAENAVSRTHKEALRAAIAIKSDLYIAHNLGALPAAAAAARYHKAKAGYDAEDMHSGQYRNLSDNHYLINKYIEEKYFIQVNYFTAASPLIAEEYQKHYPYLQPVVIDNVFPKITLSMQPGNSSALKLFWFSQTIGENRGLEDVIRALSAIRHHVELHLLGNCTDAYKLKLEKLCAETGYNSRNLYVHQPVAPHAVFEFAGRFDVGIAAEISTTLNRDICLTNKIFTYLQCGLAIAASDTSAQKKFIGQYPDAGRLYQQNNPKSLTAVLSEYINDPKALYQMRLNNYALGRHTLNWEAESKKFLRIIHQQLSES